jgi:Asp-tRNA(Asn)/Glu-tRNA(Gln) amidotransferase A subunit family amidase
MDELRKVNAAPSRPAGIPISVEDLFDVKGQVTRAGSRALDDSPAAERDAVSMARLRQAGFVLGEALSAADYIDLLSERRSLIARVNARLAPYDAPVLPTAANLPPNIADLGDDGAFAGANLRSLRNAR